MKTVYSMPVRTRGYSIEVGDIVEISMTVCDESRQHRGRPIVYEHVYHFFRVDDVTNSGRIACHDMHGKRRVIHALDNYPADSIIRVLKTGT
jgi:hypothetical protein